MSGLNIEGSREALFAWLASSQTGARGVLRIGPNKKSLVFVERTGGKGGCHDKRSSESTIDKNALAFIRENFDLLIPKEELVMARDLRKVVGKASARLGLTQKKIRKTAQETMAFALRDEMMKELGKCAGASPNAKKTIDGIVTAFINRKEIAAIENETERNMFILSLTGLLAELGFCVGSTVAERQKNLEGKMHLLQYSYQRAKEKGTLEEFFSNAFRSGPCFNGRITVLSAYAAESEGLPKEEAVQGVPAEETQFAVKVTDAYYGYRDRLETTGEIPSKEGFLSYITEKCKVEGNSKLLERCQDPSWFDKVYPQAVMAYI